MVETMHSWGPFALFTAFTAVATVWVLLLFPECKGCSMESMDALFNLLWYKVGKSSVRNSPSRFDEEISSISEKHDVDKQTEKIVP